MTTKVTIEATSHRVIATVTSRNRQDGLEVIGSTTYKIDTGRNHDLWISAGVELIVVEEEGIPS